jgi:hypothetical protein
MARPWPRPRPRWARRPGGTTVGDAARCVREVELWLRVLCFEQQFRYGDPQIAAYPSSLVSLYRTWAEGGPFPSQERTSG